MFEELSAKIQSYMSIVEEYKNGVRISFLSLFLIAIYYVLFKTIMFCKAHYSTGRHYVKLFYTL